MAKRLVSFETYCKRNIKFAAKKLPPAAREPFLKAFAATNCSDIYGGELETYLSVIAQRLDSFNRRAVKIKEIAAKLKRDLEDL